MKNRKLYIYILLGLILIGTVFFAVDNYNSTKRSVLESVEQEADELLAGFVTEVEQFSKERIVEIELMAEHLPFLIESDADIALFLAKQNKNMPHFTGLGLISPDGEFYDADGDQLSVQERDSFQKAMDGEVAFSDVFKLKQDSTQNVAAISAPVIDHSNNIIGILSGVVNLSNLVGELIQESKLPGTVFLLKNKELLFTSNKGINFYYDVPDSGLFLEEMDQIEQGNWYDPQDKHRFIKYQHIRNDWVVVVDSKSNQTIDEISQAFWICILVVVVAIFIILIIHLYIRRIDEQKRIKDEHDLLTGLGNRKRLEANITKRLSQNHTVKSVVYFIKLDHFSELTERMGYYLSDQIVFELSQRLKVIHRKQNVYRVGDEEFVLTTELTSKENQNLFAKGLIKLVNKPINLEEKEVTLTASIGVRDSKEKENMNIIMQDVMFACREASKQGGNQFVYFTKKLARESEQQRQLAINLAYALENEELYLVYQPIYCMSRDQIVSFETLMRWKSPVIGEVSPVDFIPLLEESDEIIEVGQWLIESVAKQVLKWEQEGYSEFVVTLNVSVKQLQDVYFLNIVERILSETGVNPSRLVFEVTETVVIHDVKAAKKTLEKLNQLGIKTAIDDFGTGYSSLSVLKDLPFQFMKLDRMFVMEVVSDAGRSEAILKGLIAIANSLDLITVCEGIETRDQLEVLRKLGAHRVQGYYFGKPILPKEAVTFLDKKSIIG